MGTCKTDYGRLGIGHIEGNFGLAQQITAVRERHHLENHTVGLRRVYKVKVRGLSQLDCTCKCFIVRFNLNIELLYSARYRKEELEFHFLFFDFRHNDMIHIRIFSIASCSIVEYHIDASVTLRSIGVFAYYGLGRTHIIVENFVSHHIVYAYVERSIALVIDLADEFYLSPLTRLDACDDLGHFLGFAFHAALESHFKRGALAVVHCKITCRRIVICGCSVIVQGIDEG